MYHQYIVALAVLVIISAFIPQIHGIIGEGIVAIILKTLPRDQYTVINNVLIRKEKSSSQIDHVVVSIYGIFVIETKNYSGWIMGGERSAKWTKNVYGHKYQFENPLIQNYGHVVALEKALGITDDKFFPIVVFSVRGDLKVKTSQPVIYTFSLRRTIRKQTEVLFTQEEMIDIAGRLKNLNMDSFSAHVEHNQEAAELKRTADRKIAANICPRCGGQLKLRSGKYGNFYGCTNYPRCRFTKKA